MKNQGLYEVRREHDACCIGAVVNISGKQEHSIIEYGKEILVNLHHRGAAGADEITGDGKIFVLDLNECIRIRTGERGQMAIG
ncbi:MAG: hypothetical protein GY774_10785 [Planctomycetes bacterium]|nr:hypothetical protein [Planctomycetota bacterium]